MLHIPYLMFAEEMRTKITLVFFCRIGLRRFYRISETEYSRAAGVHAVHGPIVQPEYSPGRINELAVHFPVVQPKYRNIVAVQCLDVQHIKKIILNAREIKSAGTNL